MKYKVRFTSRFKKDLKLAERQNRNFDKSPILEETRVGEFLYTYTINSYGIG